MRRFRHDERGASLFIVLAFMALISVITLSLLDFSQASFQTTDAVRGARQLNYAAGAAIDVGIKKVATDSTGLLGTTGNPCTYTVTNVEGKAATVVCTQDGAGLSPGNYAANAILTTSTAASFSLKNSGQEDLTVGGPVYSWGGIETANANNSKITSTGRLTAEVDTTACSGAGPPVRVAGSPKTCGGGSANRTFYGGNVPTWLAEPLTSASTNPNPTCSSSGWNLATFVPGLYTTALATRISAASSCNGNRAPDTLYFSPGVYYFSGAAGSVDTDKYDVVIGSPNLTTPNGNWTTSGNTSGPPTDGTACLQTAATPTQFALGNGASVTLGANNKDTNITICAGSTSRPTTQPPLVIWGASAGFGVTSPITFTAAAGALTAPSRPHAKLFVHGSIFMPSSNGRVNLKTTTEVLFDGGVVFSTLDMDVSASTQQLTSPFTIPGCVGTCSTSRNVLFTATEAGAGSPRIRVLVEYAGTLGSLPTAYRVLSWNVLR